MSTIQDMKDMLNTKLESLLASKQDEIYKSALSNANESTNLKAPTVVLDNDDLPIDNDKKERIRLAAKASDATKQGPIDTVSTSSIKTTGANEAVEELDEVSKELLGRYIKKAHASRNELNKEAGEHRGYADRDTELSTSHDREKNSKVRDAKYYGGKAANNKRAVKNGTIDGKAEHGLEYVKNKENQKTYMEYARKHKQSADYAKETSINHANKAHDLEQKAIQRHHNIAKAADKLVSK